ncbi:orotidine-5'-phosphate decarboxylase [soil metagenome]
MIFTQKLQRAVRSSNSVLSVGLDPDPDRIPLPLKQLFSDQHDLVFEFCRRIIEATKTDAVAYKPNIAFFEALGSGGWRVLEALMDVIPAAKITIADAKRGDIGSTAEKYKQAFFDKLNVDSLTLNPLMGLDTLDPFLNDASKAIYVLTLTSNRGAADFLRMPLMGRPTLGEYISEHLCKKQEKATTHIGMVVGATQTDIAENVMKVNPTAHLLMPGIGAQGGNIEMLKNLLTKHYGIPLINSSRSIIYAGGDSENWEEMVQMKASETRQSLASITKRYTD